MGGEPPIPSEVVLSDLVTTKWWPWSGGDRGLEEVARLRTVRSLRIEFRIQHPESLRFLRRMSALRVLNFNGTGAVNDVGMRYVGECGELEELYIFFADVTDEGFGHVAKLKKLRVLRTGGLALTDKSMAAIKPLRELRQLGVSGRAISDVGLTPVRDLRHLLDLDLSGTSVSDAGLGLLIGLEGLVRLDLRGTRVTSPKVAEFRRKLPSCRVEFYAPPRGAKEGERREGDGSD
jgi:hypothetical protein